MKNWYRKSSIILIFICVLIGSLNPQPKPLYAQGGTVTGKMGDPKDAYLEFTLTGADLTLQPGTTNHYSGPWTGGPITLSGKMIVTRKSDPVTGGGVSYVRFYGYLVDQRNMFKWPKDENYVLVENRTETQEASITYTIPADYSQPTVEGKIEVEVCGANVCGKKEFFFHIDIPPVGQEPVLDPSPTLTVALTKAPAPTEKVICGGDSLARFTELWGEVTIIPCFNEREEYVAERDMVLKCGDTIRTGGDSGAIVGFSDMSTFTMKARSSVILDTCQERKSNLSLLYGNIKANLKQMIEKGTLDVTMNQAVAGTKATIFVAEDTGQTSTLKVIEGEMWFQSLATGETVDVLAGQMVSADATGLSAITTFDVQAELATWPDDQNLDWSAFPITSQGSWLENLIPDFLKNPPTALVIVLLILGLLGLGLFVIIFIVRIAKKKKPSDGLEVQKSPSALPIVLMIGLIIFSCLMLTGGGIGLFLKLRQPDAVGQVSEIDQTLTALEQTESFLAQQQTINSQNQFVPDTPEPNLPQEPSLTPAPTNTVAVFIEDTPTPTNQPASTDPQLTGGQFIRENAFFDDFSSNTMGWPVKDDGLTYLDIVNQAYFFQVSEKNGFENAYFPIDFFPNDIIFDVWGPENASEGTFGVICHLQDANNYYYVDFDLAGSNYSIVQVLNGDLVTLVAETYDDQYWHSTDAFNQPATSKNRIKVSCYLGDIAVVINETLVDLIFIDQPFTKPGWAAFFVYTYTNVSDTGFQVIIDNVEAYRPVQ